MLYNHKITGQIIGRLRAKRGWSQEVLSGLADVSRSHLSMIETGRKDAAVETLWQIAAALEMPLSELIRMVEEETANQKAPGGETDDDRL